MNLFAKGLTLIAVSQTVEAVKLAEVASAIGTASAEATARLVPYFGPTIAGEQLLVERLGLDLSRALLAGQSFEWRRPFVPHESVSIRVFVEDVYEKGDKTVGVVATEIHDDSGELVQSQRTTFIEAGAA